MENKIRECKAKACELKKALCEAEALVSDEKMLSSEDLDNLRYLRKAVDNLLAINQLLNLILFNPGKCP